MARSATRAPKPPPPTEEERRAARVAHMAGVRQHLAEQHTGADCPREATDQFKAPGCWLRSMIMHINCGGGVHLYTYRYECNRCHASTTVEQ